MKTTVIYHKADYDGIFCREIAHHFLPDAELIGWDFGNPPLSVPPEGPVYILDLPVDKPFGAAFGDTDAGPLCVCPTMSVDHVIAFSEMQKRVIWIDHHASAIASHPKNIAGYRIDGVAACRLAWQWFTIVDGNTAVRPPKMSGVSPAGVLPMIQHFKERDVNEPYAVRLAGEFDIWDRRDPSAEVFQYALDAYERIFWPDLLGERSSACVIERYLPGGLAARRCINKRDADVVRERSFNLRWEGLLFLCLNTARCNSLTFQAAVGSEHDGLLGFYWNGRHWSVSLYGATHPEIDLSAIAVKYGGGGHKQACGFTCKQLPWM